MNLIKRNLRDHGSPTISDRRRRAIARISRTQTSKNVDLPSIFLSVYSHKKLGKTWSFDTVHIYVFVIHFI